MDDEKIVDLLYLHDENGLTETKNKYESMLTNISYRVVNNMEDAIECVNDTYMKIWDRIPPYKPNYYKSFICKIIRQISIDKYRYNNRNSRDIKNSIYISDLDYEIRGINNIEEDIQEKDLKDKLNKFIEDLNIEDRVLFIRKYFFFEDTNSLSKRFGISEANINVKMFRIRKKLKKYLEREGYIIENNK